MQDEHVHDRTHRLAKMAGVDPNAVRKLVGRRVVLELSADAAGTDVGKLAFLTLCNLATRLGPYVPNLEVFVPANVPPLKSPVYANGSSLADQALWILREAIAIEDCERQAARRHRRR